MRRLSIDVINAPNLVTFIDGFISPVPRRRWRRPVNWSPSLDGSLGTRDALSLAVYQSGILGSSGVPLARDALCLSSSPAAKLARYLSLDWRGNCESEYFLSGRTPDECCAELTL